MRKRKSKKKIILILLIIFGLSIGFAYISTILGINGVALLGGQTFEVKYTDIRLISSTASVNQLEIGPEGNTIDFQVNFTGYNQSVSFYVIAENTGTIDGMFDTSNLVLTTSANTYENPEFIDYELQYSNGAPVSRYERIDAGESATYIITISLTSSAETYINNGSLSGTVSTQIETNYMEADENAVDHPAGSTTCPVNNAIAASVVSANSSDVSQNPSSGGGDGIQSNTVAALCRRATSLHTETCNERGNSGSGFSDYYCMGDGYLTPSSDDYRNYNIDSSLYKNTTQIIYGNCGNIGQLHFGDAFTCDVNGDGEFDEDLERFYYISNTYVDNILDEQIGDKISLFYQDISQNFATLLYAYPMYNKNAVTDTLVTNRYFVKLYQDAYGNRDGEYAIRYIAPTDNFPDTESWFNRYGYLYPENHSLMISRKRRFPTIDNDSFPYQYDYYLDAEISARPLTYQELKAGIEEAKGETVTFQDMQTNYFFRNYNFLYERTAYAYPRDPVGNDHNSRILLDASISKTNDSQIAFIDSSRGNLDTMLYAEFGVLKPAIEVPIDLIDY